MSLGGLYLFSGPDRARKFQRIQALERSLAVQPFDRHHLDASASSAAELVALCRQQPAASRLRLVVVDQAHRIDPEGVEALLRHAAAIAQTACVVLLVEREPAQRHPLAKPPAAVTVEEFPARDAPAAKPFALADALGSRDAAWALTAAQDQLAAGKEPLELLGLVAWQLNRWVMVRRLCDAGCSAEQIVAVTGLRPWQVDRLRTEVARRPLGALQRTLARCWQLDVDAKSGRHVPELALQQLILEVCLAGNPTRELTSSGRLRG